MTLPMRSQAETLVLSHNDEELPDYIVDGAIRDVKEIRELGFPVFARAVVPKPALKAVVLPLQEPVNCGGVLVHPNDFIVADEEGIVAVPAERLETVLKAVSEKAQREKAQTLDAWDTEHDEKINSILRAAGVDW
ncbi:RraA family protein [Paenarthrobacter sp. PH39-S1]|uniref:RraA family protein n=1 Tax=Paenarthrobacter sp. PH39-S1 TaxID=3046204 RepID=UPI0024B991A7|nr:RraA family protein [Paenarthrobacter sp. PH39-S1]MDJ0356310.1 RraA family protein [Paenarthrobacter sp. PH39-S1]